MPRLHWGVIKMSVRVTRGLFRLWLVFSVLWIAGVGAVTWRTFPVNDWTVTDVAFDRERRAAVQFATLLALVPPLFLFALGAALRWVFMGFRP